MTWKTVELAEVSVLYIYTYIYIDEVLMVFVDRVWLLSKKRKSRKSLKLCNNKFHFIQFGIFFCLLRNRNSNLLYISFIAINYQLQYYRDKVQFSKAIICFHIGKIIRRFKKNGFTLKGNTSLKFSTYSQNFH